eukprot:7856988-Pyramimonas_sp.AAC.1
MFMPGTADGRSIRNVEPGTADGRNVEEEARAHCSRTLRRCQGGIGGPGSRVPGRPAQRPAASTYDHQRIFS